MKQVIFPYDGKVCDFSESLQQAICDMVEKNIYDNSNIRIEYIPPMQLSYYSWEQYEEEFVNVHKDKAIYQVFQSVRGTWEQPIGFIAIED